MEPDPTDPLSMMPLARVGAYALPGDVRIEDAIQRDGSVLWAVRRGGGACLNRELQWEYEPMPSSRDAEFFARCRWPTPKLGYEAWVSRVSQDERDQLEVHNIRPGGHS